MRDAQSALIKHGDIVLAVGEAARGGLQKPLYRRRIVRLAPVPASAQHRQVVHGLQVALLCSPAVPNLRARQIDLNAQPALVKRTKAILGHGEALARRALIPT